MDLSERQQSASKVARHPWEIARARFFVDVIARTGAPSHVLDVGAGDAYVATRILERFQMSRVTAWDAAYTDAEIEELERAHAHDRLTATRAKPNEEGAFDLALLLDVLEHVDDDAAALDDVLSLLAPDARVLVSVPAWPAMFGAHDMQLRHRRRYTPRQCRSLLTSAGLTIVEAGGLFHSLLAPRWAALALERATAVTHANGVGGWRKPAVVTALVDGALRVDNAVSRASAKLGVDVPGLSFWALCRTSAAR